MPLYILDETKQALGGESLQHLQSRSLFLDRYAEPDSKEDVRKDWFSKMIGKSAVGESLRRSWLPASSSNLYARLRSRMMLNMSGGAMENANVCLDRYGIPYIPGSAIKGCARRAALAALHEWSETKTKPSGSDNAFTASCQPFKAPEAMLEAIASVFGWGDMDWKQGADFAWAMSSTDSTECGLPARDPQSKGQGSRSKQFSGTIAFLPAYPNTDPTLELDVLTPHHGDYYSEKKDTQGRLVMPFAHDTENPVPVYFPSVKSQEGTQNYYTFPLLPLRNADTQLLGYARTWLKCGLETFGIGAKTAAGYGWFNCSESDSIKKSIDDQIHKAKELAKAEAARQEEERQKAAQKLEEEKREQERQANLSPEEAAKEELRKQSDEQFADFAKNLHGKSKEQQIAFIDLMRTEKKERWKMWKKKKPPLAQSITDIVSKLVLSALP